MYAFDGCALLVRFSWSSTAIPVGATPTVTLSRVVASSGARVLAKCEHLNPTGSLKDRVAVRMLRDIGAALSGPSRLALLKQTVRRWQRSVLMSR